MASPVPFINGIKYPLKYGYRGIIFRRRFAFVTALHNFIHSPKNLKNMKKFLFATLIALTGLAQQVFANDIVNNTNCDVRVTAVVYSASTAACSVLRTCMSVTVPAHSTASLPMCVVAGADELLGFDVCWSDVPCATIACASIGNSTGPYPCAQFPAGPVFLPPCDSCSPAVGSVRISWLYATAGGANLIIG
jgi:hypothetical protein